jgi:hypothetical protein
VVWAVVEVIEMIVRGDNDGHRPGSTDVKECAWSRRKIGKVQGKLLP